MPAKKTDEEAPPEEAPAEAEAAATCVNCGAPATQRTTNPGVSEVFYCDRHAQASGEGVTPI